MMSSRSRWSLTSSADTSAGVSVQILVWVLLLVVVLILGTHTSICAGTDIGVLVLVLEVTDRCSKLEYKVQTRNLF